MDLLHPVGALRVPGLRPDQAFEGFGVGDPHFCCLGEDVNAWTHQPPGSARVAAPKADYQKTSESARHSAREPRVEPADGVRRSPWPWTSESSEVEHLRHKDALMKAYFL